MLRQDNVLIGQILVDEGVITPEQLDVSLKEQKKTNSLICTTIIRLGYASEERVFSLLSRQPPGTRFQRHMQLCGLKTSSLRHVQLET